MNFYHDFSAVAQMQDNCILIAGGSYGGGIAPGYNYAEIYNPTNGSYSATGSLNYPSMNTSAATLSVGKVLLVSGWYDPYSATYPELYNPLDKTFTLTGPLNTPRSDIIVIPTTDGVGL